MKRHGLVSKRFDDGETYWYTQDQRGMVVQARDPERDVPYARRWGWEVLYENKYGALECLDYQPTFKDAAIRLHQIAEERGASGQREV